MHFSSFFFLFFCSVSMTTATPGHCRWSPRGASSVMIPSSAAINKELGLEFESHVGRPFEFSRKNKCIYNRINCRERLEPSVGAIRCYY